MTAVDHARLRELAGAATPGPWAQGDVWSRAGVLPERFGDGRCTFCNRLGEPVWSGMGDINGTRMMTHLHRNSEPYSVDHLISGADYGLVAGNYDYETGGIISPSDTAYIAAVSPDVVLALLDEREALVAEVATLRQALGMAEHALTLVEGCPEGTVTPLVIDLVNEAAIEVRAALAAGSAATGCGPGGIGGSGTTGATTEATTDVLSPGPLPAEVSGGFIHQETTRIMGVETVDFGPVMGTEGGEG